MVSSACGTVCTLPCAWYIVHFTLCLSRILCPVHSALCIMPYIYLCSYAWALCVVRILHRKCCCWLCMAHCTWCLMSSTLCLEFLVHGVLSMVPCALCASCRVPCHGALCIVPCEWCFERKKVPCTYPCMMPRIWGLVHEPCAWYLVAISLWMLHCKWCHVNSALWMDLVQCSWCLVHST
jgi:hypothetical protein